MEKERQAFVTGCAANHFGAGGERSSTIDGSFASYAFNKSHAACYALMLPTRRPT